MEQIEITVFENTSALDEQAVSVAVLGKVSIRQLVIIFSGLLVAVGVFQITASPVYAAIPALIGIILGVPRPKVLSMDRLAYSVLLFFLKEINHKASKKPAITKPNSTFLRMPAAKIVKIKREEKLREIIASDLTKLRWLKIRIIDPSGDPLPGTFVRIYLDGELIDSLSTDSDGMIEASFVPGKEGQRRLKITSDMFDEPVLDEIILVKTS